MRYSDELAIRHAIKYGDSNELAKTVEGLGRHVWFDEVLNVVNDMPGSWRHVDTIGDIVCGDVRIEDHFGAPRVVRR